MELEEKVKDIDARNKRVELDKKWETSFTRKASIAVFTYITIVLFFLVADLPGPFINPIVPTIGFILYTLSLPYIRNFWQRNK